MREFRFYVYILASRREGTLYTGVTNNLDLRVWQHRNDVFDGFTKRYAVHRLAWFEIHDDIRVAIEREKRIKRWRRAWKIALIETMNPEWEDLYEKAWEGNAEPMASHRSCLSSRPSRARAKMPNDFDAGGAAQSRDPPAPWIPALRRGIATRATISIDEDCRGLAGMTGIGSGDEPTSPDSQFHFPTRVIPAKPRSREDAE